MRRPAGPSATLALALISCAAPSALEAERVPRAQAAALRACDLVINIGWTSLDHEPLASRIVPEFLAPDGLVAAFCTPEPSSTFAARCRVSGTVAGWVDLAIALPPELGGSKHRRLMVPRGSTDGRIEVDVWIAMAPGDRPFIDEIKLRRQRPPPAGLVLRRDSTPRAGEPLNGYPLDGFSVVNDTRETLRWSDAWLETLPGRGRWTCMGHGNGSGGRVPLDPGGIAHPRIGPPGAHFVCAPPVDAGPESVHRLVVRLLGEAVSVPVPADGWSVRAPNVSEQPIYELSDKFVLR